MKHPRHRKTVLQSIFTRSGGAGKYTDVYENLQAGKQDLLMDQVPHRADELPVAAYHERSVGWVFITTQRLCSSQQQGDLTLELEDLQDGRVFLQIAEGNSVMENINHLNLAPPKRRT